MDNIQLKLYEEQQKTNILLKKIYNSITNNKIEKFIKEYYNKPFKLTELYKIEEFKDLFVIEDTIENILKFNEYCTKSYTYDIFLDINDRSQYGYYAGNILNTRMLDHYNYMKHEDSEERLQNKVKLILSDPFDKYVYLRNEYTKEDLLFEVVYKNKGEVNVSGRI